MLIDDRFVPRFGFEAISAIPDCTEIIVYSCTNTRNVRHLIKHAAYYALNLVTIRNSKTAPVDIAVLGDKVIRVRSFESRYSGIWQSLPEEIIEDMATAGPDFILKLGMNLLRVPTEGDLPVPILSFHHGDPDHFRGRPAGFWEMVRGSPRIGQIIQVLGNKLDAGRVLAYGETRVLRHSYRATLLEAYGHSPLLMAQALRSLASGTSLDKPCKGRNYRLPSNLTVATMVLRMTARWLARLFYGAFVEKRWQVSLAPAGGERLDLLAPDGFPEPPLWRTVETDRAFAFYADPFFSAEPPGVLVEALGRKSGRGEILLLPDGGGPPRRVSAAPGHLSYPASVICNEVHYLVPEMAEWSLPRIFEFRDGVFADAGPLRVKGDARLLDPTLLNHEGRFYLFANPYPQGSNALCLWVASSLEDEFDPHPCSPILISPRGARMAGQILESEGRPIRLGQDFRSAYGDGILAFRIEELTPQSYVERQISTLRFTDRSGPHTLNFRGGEAVFDWYREAFSPAAGIRRLLARASRR